MKKVLLASFIASAFAAQAQFSIGPVVGVGVQGPRSLSYTSNSSYSSVTRSSNGTIVNQYSSSGTGGGILPSVSAGLSYNVGVQAKIDMGKYFAISPSLLFQHMSSKFTSAFGTGNQSFNYISVPVILQGQYPITKSITVGLGVGPQFNFFVGGSAKNTYGGTTTKVKLKGKGTIDEASAKGMEEVNNDSDMNNDIDYVKPFSASLNIAPFVQFKFGGMSLLVSPTYYIGLTNVLPATKYTSTTTTTSGSFTTVETNVVDEKPSSKTGGFGVNVSLLFGGK